MTYMFEMITKAKAPMPRASHFGPEAKDAFSDWNERKLCQEMGRMAARGQAEKSGDPLRVRICQLMKDGRERTLVDVSRAVGKDVADLRGTMRRLTTEGCLVSSRIKGTLVWRISGEV